MAVSPDNQILLNDDQFWVTFRGRQFGPFAYQWSNDLYGVEFLYRGDKFGEVCSEDEFFADLQPYELPMSVCQVATLTAGIIAEAVQKGRCVDQRVSRLIELLHSFGLDRFEIREL
ncbi:MAG: hypothetical protein R3C20_01235 [Planctomycetaceae bacterium]